MSDVMEFPNTFEEFINEHSIVSILSIDEVLAEWQKGNKPHTRSGI